MLQGIALTWLDLVTTPTTPYHAFVVAFIVAGMGMTFFFVPIASLVLGSVKKEEEGLASGANASFRELGGVLGIAVLGSVFSANGGYTSAHAFVSGLHPSIYVGAGVVLIGAVTASFLPRMKMSRVQKKPAPKTDFSSLTRFVMKTVGLKTPQSVGARFIAPDLFSSWHH
jgi:uncharacterized membrane protein YedE/YeeE